MVKSQLYLSNYLDTRFRPSIQVEEKDVEEFYKERVVPRAEERSQTPPTLEAGVISFRKRWYSGRSMSKPTVG